MIGMILCLKITYHMRKCIIIKRKIIVEVKDEILLLFIFLNFIIGLYHINKDFEYEYSLFKYTEPIYKEYLCCLDIS